ncbi:MAG: hypothetical protein HGA62_05230 [Chlorobiaceae bacterium]|nr:hypothetical protein [Chlorobiaceae bacterium]NTV61125.1 hypothetical protein [Chlorobiaceae bacterium]
MGIKEAYKKKAEAEVELAQARLAEFKAKGKTMAEEMHVRYAEQIVTLEHGIDSARLKLKEVGEAGEDRWEHLKDGVENALRSLSSGIHSMADKLK